MPAISTSSARKRPARQLFGRSVSLIAPRLAAAQVTWRIDYPYGELALGQRSRNIDGRCAISGAKEDH